MVTSVFQGRAINLHLPNTRLVAPPQPFNKDVIDPATLAIHADLNTFAVENTGKFNAPKLDSLIRVQGFRSAVLFQSLFQRIYAGAGIERLEYLPGKKLSVSSSR